MAIKKIKNGKYKVDISLGIDPDTGKRKRKIKNNIKTYNEAKEIELKFLDSLSLTSYNFDTLFIDYLKHLELTLKPSSSAKKEGIYRIHIQEYFKDFDIGDITSNDIRKFKETLIPKKISNNYKRQIMIALSSFLNYFVKYEMLRFNPAKRVDNFKKEKTEMKFWSLEEFKLFDKQIDELVYKVFFRLLFYTGMRKGEVLGLTWNDINFITKTIQVRRTCSMVKKIGYVISTPKTEESKRTIYLNNKIIELLKEYKEDQQRKSNFNINNHLIIKESEVIPKTSITRTFKTYIKQAGIKEIRIHDLRHSHVALLINLKEDPLVIKKRLGHTDITITLNTYGHLYNDRDKELADKLDLL